MYIGAFTEVQIEKGVCLKSSNTEYLIALNVLLIGFCISTSNGPKYKSLYLRTTGELY